MSVTNKNVSGDSGYALEPLVMTPIVDAPENTSLGDLYTQWHCNAKRAITLSGQMGISRVPSDALGLSFLWSQGISL